MREPIENWRSLDIETLIAQFSPRIAVPDAQDRLDKWAARSSELAPSFPGRYDIRYGEGAKMTLDLHPADEPLAPVVAFIHGGYWRRLDKSDHMFAAYGLHRSGFTVININYDLCPTVTLTALNKEIAVALRFIADHAAVWGFADAPLYVMGHSAGAHAAVFAAADPGLPDRVAGIIPVSGIFDTNAVVRLPVAEEIGLDANEAVAMNVMTRAPHRQLRALIAVGGGEPPAWIGQSSAWHRMASSHIDDCRLQIVPATDHFSVLEACCDPDHPAGRTIAEFIGGPVH